MFCQVRPCNTFTASRFCVFKVYAASQRTTSTRRQSTLVTAAGNSTQHGCNAAPSRETFSTTSLERVATPAILRNLFLGSMITSPTLFYVGSRLLDKMANAKTRLLNPDTNSMLRAIVKPLFYDQFCAGTNKQEIYKTRDSIRKMGFAGVILCYGKEMQLSASNTLHSTGKGCEDQRLEIEAWKKGNLDTLDMVGAGDWLGLKFTGAGPGTTNSLMANEKPSVEFLHAMDAICEKAASKNCRLWVDAEQQVFQTAIDNWTIALMRKYNKNGRALVYSTLQSYLKASREKLKSQLALAASEDWTLAIKLVRGAYIANDQRDKIHDTKADTDASYNGIVQDLLSGSNLGFDRSDTQAFPNIALFLAGHNPESVSRAWDLVQSLSAQGKLKVLPDFGQLQGMSDQLSCQLLEQCEMQSQKGTTAIPKVYKCLTWGSLQECMQYLLRRLVENKGSADRMRDGMQAYRHELWKRLFGRRVKRT